MEIVENVKRDARFTAKHAALTIFICKNGAAGEGSVGCEGKWASRRGWQGGNIPKHAETALCVAIFGLSLCPALAAAADADFGFGYGICCGKRR